MLRLPIFKMAAACGFGLYLVGGGNWSLPTGKLLPSVVDTDCASLWREGARNDPTLKCYLTHQVKRLCDESERLHLVQFFSRYERSRKKFEATLRLYLTGVAVNYQMTGGETLQRYSTAQEKAAKQVGTSEVKAALAIETMSNREIRTLIEALAKKGLLLSSDLDGGEPYYVQEVLDEAKHKVAACRKSATR